jgi:DNA modification methylase
MIHHGDALEILKTLEAESVHTCVTSPPYWGLRDYGVEGQLGLEHTPQEFITKLVAIFREVKRVLRKDGTIWVNMGDSYAQGGSGGCSDKSTLNGGCGVKEREKLRKMAAKSISRKVPNGLKPKDLCGIPWRLAFALQADGWYLRSDIIWSKPNPMPESCQDRPTKAHEYIFLLSRSEQYYYDIEAIKEPAIYQAEDTWPAGWANGSDHSAIAHNVSENRSKIRKDEPKGSFNGKHGDEAFRAIREMKNKRTVWEVPTFGFAEAHFATFPPKLIEPCILAGSPRGGIVLDPFFGSGTTGLVALQNARKFIGIELNPEYIKMAEKRLLREDTTPTMFDLTTGEM